MERTGEWENFLADVILSECESSVLFVQMTHG